MVRRRGPLDLGIILLAYNLLNVGLEHIPPLTLGFTLFQTLLYLGYVSPPWRHGVNNVCLSSVHVLERHDLGRIFFSAVEHVDDMHLYYNMSSFLLKGRSLEKRFGARKFLVLLFVLTASTGMCYVGLLEGAARHLNPSYRHECAVGFSGVIFALKVLTTHFESSRHRNPRSVSSFMGISVSFPTRYAVWLELLLIHILVPRSSFAGHLAGILVGLAYITGPLEVATEALDSIVCGVLRIFGFDCGGETRSRRRGGWLGRNSYTYAHGTASSRREQTAYEEEEDQPPDLSTYYSQPEDHYRAYSRSHFVPPPSYRRHQ